MRTPAQKCVPRATPKASEEKQSRRKGSSSKTPSSSCKKPHTSKHDSRSSSDTTAPKERHNTDQSEMTESMGKSSVAQVGRSITKKKGKNRMDEYPIHNKFCYTAEELHEEYGLSIEKKKNAKVYLHHLQPSFIDDCRLLFHKVYQGPPSCGEITAKFARCYAFEKCHAAKKDPARHKIAWARFGESVLNMCSSKPGGLDKKVENWKRANGAFHGHYFDNIHCHDISICDLQNECVVLETECAEAQIQSEFVTMMIAKINEGRRFTLFPRPHIKDEDNTIYALGSCVACGECLGFTHVVGSFMLACKHQYHPLCLAATLMKKDICAKVGCNERISKVAKAWAHKGHVQKKCKVKEEYTDNHAADKHSKDGHIFYEEMEDGGKCCDVEMQEAATHSFQGMSNEVQSDKLDENKDTTTRAHKGVNDRREEPDHEVLPDQ
ncbi:hypothetical protein L7F22_064101 [Adiantum nelumboides]|nr:hypothetical protein [Adiantum nelumboides]